MTNKYQNTTLMNNNAGVHFIHNHPPPPGQTPGTRLKGSKNLPPPGTIIVYKTLPSAQNRESKAPPPGHKIREFHKYIYEL